jgi:hypothetical protein
MDSAFSEDILSTLKKFIDQKIDESYTKIYVGKVADNDDPDRLGRCKIQVPGIFDNIQVIDLPWSYPDQTFIGSKKGNFIVPPVDTLVNVYFDKGDIYEPRYTTKVIDKANLIFSADIEDDYPDTMVFFETDQGDYFKVNRRTGEFKIKSSTGALITIDQNGSVRITTTGSDTGDLQVTLEGKCAIDAQDVVTITSKIATTIDSPMVTIGSSTGPLTLMVDKPSGVVAPNPLGGPFNALPVDPLTGSPHQGNTFIG